MSIETFAVTPEHDSTRLDRFLVSAIGSLSRSQLQRLIKNGHVLVDGTAGSVTALPFVL